MKLTTGNISDSAGAFKKTLGDDTSNINKLKASIELFCSSKLTGDTYKALKEYYENVIIETGLVRRTTATEALSKQMITGGALCLTEFWDDFMEKDPATTEIDTVVIGDLESKIDSLSDNMNEYNSMSEKERKKNGYTSFTYTHWRDEKEKLSKLLHKIVEFIREDSSYSFAETEAIVTNYCNFVNSLNVSKLGFSPSDGSEPLINKDETTEVEDKDGGDETTKKEIDYSTLGSGGGGGGSDDSDGSTGNNTNQTKDPDTEKDPDSIKTALSNMVTTAASMIGMTATDLAADSNNTFYGSDYNYTEGEEWSTKFVNDVILRDETLANTLDDYYNNPTLFSNPYTDSQDLMNYAIEKDSNMDFNWSSSQGDAIYDYYMNSENPAAVDIAIYEPQKGDIVFFDSEDPNINFNGDMNNTNTVGKVGIVESVETITDSDGNTKMVVNVIQGNTPTSGDSPVVSKAQYDLEDKKILGYGTILDNGSDLKSISEHPDTSIKPVEPETPEIDDGNIHLTEGDNYSNLENSTIDSEGQVYVKNEEGNYSEDVGNIVDVGKDDSGNTTINPDVEVDITNPNTDKPLDYTDLDLPDSFDEVDKDLIKWDF